jgi:hypothetical protein
MVFVAAGVRASGDWDESGEPAAATRINAKGRYRANINHLLAKMSGREPR